MTAVRPAAMWIPITTVSITAGPSGRIGLGGQEFANQVGDVVWLFLHHQVPGRGQDFHPRGAGDVGGQAPRPVGREMDIAVAPQDQRRGLDLV